MRWILCLFPLLSFTTYAQCKTYSLGVNGDTLNCTDYNDNRKGKWVVKVASLRGEPGYDEEGIYIDGQKEGVWRIYSSMGDLTGIEQYRWGYKDGKSQYYNIAGLIREESWRAVNPKNPYDTIPVPDPINPTKVEMKVVKLEGTSLRHGTWKFYESGSGSIISTETYFLNKLRQPGEDQAMANKITADSLSVTKKPIVKPKEVEEFEKKNSKKKKIKVIDGRTY